jgi:glyoxylase-like metal-dependent hydrolase (beta-lactamase superfamily II)
MPNEMPSEGLTIHTLPLGPWDNFIYLLADEATKTCAVVDPAWHAPSILQEAQRLNLEITHILCTHSHFDHVNRVEKLLETLDVPVHMLRPEIEFSGYRCENLVPSSPGDTLRVGKHVDVTMMHTPGHTPGSCSYRLRDAIVTGDTLFVDGCGRCDFVGGDPELMHHTLQNLLEKLPGDTVMYPGHDYGPTASAALAQQRGTNPYLQHKTVADFVAHRMKGKAPNTGLSSPPEWGPTDS